MPRRRKNKRKKAASERNRGMERLDALIDACHKRARPIIMTTVAMVGGMSPILFGFVEGDSSFRLPMAIVLVGGLVTSTLLSLVVIPVVFTFMDDLEGWTKRVFKIRPKHNVEQKVFLNGGIQ